MDSKTTIIIVAIVAIIAIAAAAFFLTNNGGNNSGPSDDPGDNTQNASENLKNLTTKLDSLYNQSASYPARLMILGNADLDDDIDNADVAAIEKLIKNGYTYTDSYFADANYDGIIDSKDVAMVKELIDYKNYKGKVNYLNCDYYIRTYDMGAPLYLANTLTQSLQIMMILCPDKIVSTDDRCHKWKNIGTFYKEFESVLDYGDENNKDKMGSIGDRRTYTAEHILEVSREYANGYLTAWLQSNRSNTNIEDGVAGTNTQIVRLPGWEKGAVVNGVLTAGYLFHAYDKAVEYTTWHDGIWNDIQNRIAKIPESERKKVVVLTMGDTDNPQPTTYDMLYKPAGEYMDAMYSGCVSVAEKYYKDKGLPESQYSVTLSAEDLIALYQSYGYDLVVGTFPGPFNTTAKGIDANYDARHAVLDTASGGKAKMLYYGWIYCTGPHYLGYIAMLCNAMYGWDLDLEKITNDCLKMEGIYGTGEGQWTYETLAPTLFYTEDYEF